MKACNKCLENMWKFSKNEDYIVAQCQNCGSEFSWIPQQKPRIEKAGDRCACGGRVQFKAKKPKKSKAVSYSGYFHCPKCRKIYFSDQFKVVNQEACKRNIEKSLKLAFNLENKELLRRVDEL